MLQSDGATLTNIYQGWIPGTSDTSLTWSTGTPATYMQSDGSVVFQFCACPNGSTMYTISSNLMRVTLNLVGSAPVANFSGAPTSGSAPLAVTFTDSSTNTPTSWSWTFGDSNTSTVQNPSHTYSSAGTYTVALTATNAYGNNTNTKNNYITAGNPPVANFTGSPTQWRSSLERDLHRQLHQQPDRMVLDLR